MRHPTVASVGPYTFHSAPTRASNDRARALSSASPPLITRRCEPPAQPPASSTRSSVGVTNIALTPWAAIRAASAVPSTARARLTTSMLAPAHSGTQRSKHDTSKPTGDTARNTSSSR
jgi:hypothetical protein